MTRKRGRRFVWPLLAAAALAAVTGGTRTSLTDPVASFLGLLLTVFGVSILVALPGLGTLALASRRPLSAATRLGMLLAGSGVAAFVEFWAWVASPTLGRVLAVVLLVASLAIVATVRPTVLLDDPELRGPFGVCLLVVLGYLGLAYSQGGLGGLHWTSGGPAGDATLAMSYRFWIAPDNTLPLLFAQRVAHHGGLTVPLLADWHTSDRPPLQTGFTLMLYPLLGHRSFGYELLGTVLQALWIPALWVLLRSRGIDKLRVLAVVLVTAATGAIFVNTVYVWPKMLAGALALVAFAVVLEEGSLILAAVLAALALLSHGGIAFSLLALLVLVWRLRPTAIQAASALGAGLVLYLPWMAYQHFIDPPGDRLLKWQIAGVLALDRNSFLHDLVRQYLHNPLHSFVLDKLRNVETLVGQLWIWRSYPQWQGFLGEARVAGITSFVLSAGPLLVGGALGLASATVRRSLRSLAPASAFVLLSLVFWVILEFGANTAITALHQGSYAAVLLMIALAALATTYLQRWLAVSIIGAALAWFALEWLPGLGFRWAQPGLATSTDWPMVGLAAASLAGIGLRLVRTRTRGVSARGVVHDAQRGDAGAGAGLEVDPDARQAPRQGYAKDAVMRTGR